MTEDQPRDLHRRLQYELRNRLPMWVVYNTTTKDFPGRWVARMHLSLPAQEVTPPVVVGDSLDAIREQLPEGLTNIGRQPGDDPVIVEVWI